MKERAINAAFDERLALLGMLLDQIGAELQRVMEGDRLLQTLFGVLKAVKAEAAQEGAALNAILDAAIAVQEETLEKGKLSNALSGEQQRILQRICGILEEEKQQVRLADGGFAVIKQDFDVRRAAQKAAAMLAGEHLEHLFSFCESAFSDGNELLILVTELTIHPHSADFISRYGCEKYFAHNAALLLHERELDLLQQIEALNI